MNALLPADGSSQGFDNLAEAAVSPSLIQGYVSAMKISRLAVGDRTAAVADDICPPRGRRTATSTVAARHARRRGVPYTFPLDAEYEFSLGGRGAGPGGLDLTLDGAQVKVDNPRGFRVKVTAGPHAIGLALVDRQRGAGVDEITPTSARTRRSPRRAACPLVVTGPFNATGAGDTEPPRDLQLQAGKRA